MLRPIALIQKKNKFGLRYKPDKRGRQRLAEEKKKKRITSFLKKEKESVKMEMPPLSYTFLSTSYVNPEVFQNRRKEMMVGVAKTFGSLSIDMVEIEDQEARNVRLPPFPLEQILNNWTSIEFPVVFKFQNE